MEPSLLDKCSVKKATYDNTSHEISKKIPKLIKKWIFFITFLSSDYF